jgi:hypothetical protein
MLKKQFDSFYLWYKKSFPIVLPLLLLSGISLLFNYIPYINLVAGTMSVIVIFVSAVLLWLFTLQSKSGFFWILLLSACAFVILDLLNINYLAEVFSGVFYLLLFAYCIVALWRKDSSHSS